MFTLLLLMLVPNDQDNVSAALLFLVRRLNRSLRRRLKLRRRISFTFEIRDGFDVE